MITANEIITKGVKVIEENLNKYDEAFISVHGKINYAVVTIEHILLGKLKDYHRISINFKFLIMLHLIIREDEIILQDFGSHDHLHLKPMDLCTSARDLSL